MDAECRETSFRALKEEKQIEKQKENPEVQLKEKDDKIEIMKVETSKTAKLVVLKEDEIKELAESTKKKIKKSVIQMLNKKMKRWKKRN